MGGTAAHKISLHWDIELKDDNGHIVGFSMEDGVPAITILLPGESISKIIGAHHSFMERHPDTEYTGSITFEDPSGYKYKQPFRLDGRPFLNTPSYDHEALKTHSELQKLPDEIKKLRNAIEKFISR